MVVHPHSSVVFELWFNLGKTLQGRLVLFPLIVVHITRGNPVASSVTSTGH